MMLTLHILILQKSVIIKQDKIKKQYRIFKRKLEADSISRIKSGTISTLEDENNKIKLEYELKNSKIRK